MRPSVFAAPPINPHVGYPGHDLVTIWVPHLDPAPKQGSLSRGRAHGNPIAPWTLKRPLYR